MVAAATRDVFVQQLRDTWGWGEDDAIVFLAGALRVGGDSRDTAYPKISPTPVNLFQIYNHIILRMKLTNR